MYFERIQATHVRNLNSNPFEPGTKLNFLIGQNASGKTAFLEAVYILARGKSFRTAKIKDVINHEEAEIQVTARIKYRNRTNSEKAGIKKGKGQTKIRLNGETVKTISEQAKNIPIILFDPESKNVITGTPKNRRHWLDWSLFHVEQGYLDVWKEYHRALRQRNFLLKNKNFNNELLSGWEKIMEQTAKTLTRQRSKYIREVKEDLIKTASLSCLNNNMLDIKLASGEREGKEFLTTLLDGRTGDARLGHTRYGPHRADIMFNSEEKQIADVFSRGQIKLFMFILMLSQSNILMRRTNEIPVLLIDDLSAELDDKTKQFIFKILKEIDNQVFITSTIPEISRIIEGSVFHVEQGALVKYETKQNLCRGTECQKKIITARNK